MAAERGDAGGGAREGSRERESVPGPGAGPSGRPRGAHGEAEAPRGGHDAAGAPATGTPPPGPERTGSPWMLEPADLEGDTVVLRLVMPDRWLEHVEELPVGMTVADAKLLGLRNMLQRDTDDPDDFYVEYAERHVLDETTTLRDLDVQPREILSIRAYDAKRSRPFRG